MFQSRDDAHLHSNLRTVSLAHLAPHATESFPFCGRDAAPSGVRQLQLCFIHHSWTAPFSLMLGLPTTVLATQKHQQPIQLGSLFPLSSQPQVLASHRPKFVFHFCWGREPCWQERQFPWVPPDAMKFEINGGETKTSPSWKSRAGLVAFLWYEMPLQPASFFSPLTDILSF